MHNLVSIHMETGVNRRIERTARRSVQTAFRKPFFASSTVILDSLARWEGCAEELGVRAVVTLEPLGGAVARGCASFFHVIVKVLAREELRKNGLVATPCQ
jgi:hypothetical protein